MSCSIPFYLIPVQFKTFQFQLYSKSSKSANFVLNSNSCSNSGIAIDQFQFLLSRFPVNLMFTCKNRWILCGCRADSCWHSSMWWVVRGWRQGASVPPGCVRRTCGRGSIRSQTTAASRSRTNRPSHRTRLASPRAGTHGTHVSHLYHLSK